jgi:hypothetical protein
MRKQLGIALWLTLAIGCGSDGAGDGRTALESLGPHDRCGALDSDFCASFARVHVGPYAARGLWRAAAGPAPAIILLPGSGPNGPEEMMMADATLDGREHALLLEIAEPFAAAGWSVLSLGKPGVEFFAGFAQEGWFYDAALYQRLRWSELVASAAAAVELLRAEPAVDPQRIYVLGHSEGTQLAVDLGRELPDLAGYFLLGFAGEDMSTILDWQLYRRMIEQWLAPDVDLDRDAAVSRSEAGRWPEFSWEWREGQESVSFAEIEAELRASPDLAAIRDQIAGMPLYGEGVGRRGPLYDEVAALPGDVVIATGALDVQTLPGQALRAGLACAERGKRNYAVHVVQGLGHGFSPPRGPRRQPLLDLTLGPIDRDFRALLGIIAGRIARPAETPASAP